MCLSFCEHVSGTAGPIRTELCVQIPCGFVFFGSVALHCVLPVLWMMSRLAVMGATPKGGG